VVAAEVVGMQRRGDPGGLVNMHAPVDARSDVDAAPAGEVGRHRRSGTPDPGSLRRCLTLTTCGPKPRPSSIRTSRSPRWSAARLPRRSRPCARSTISSTSPPPPTTSPDLWILLRLIHQRGTGDPPGANASQGWCAGCRTLVVGSGEVGVPVPTRTTGPVHRGGDADVEEVAHQ